MRLLPDSNLDLGPVQRIDFRWFFLTLVSGLALIGLAIAGDVAWCWRSIYSAVLVNLGTAVVLVSVLAFVERHLVRTLATAYEPAYCTLAEPPTLIARQSTWGGPDTLICGHENPQHRWDIDTGRRQPDYNPPEK